MYNILTSQHIYFNNSENPQLINNIKKQITKHIIMLFKVVARNIVSSQGKAA